MRIRRCRRSDPVRGWSRAGRRALRLGVCAAVALLAVPALSTCTAGREKVPAGQLRIATGSQTGVYYVYGEAIKKVVEQRIPQLTPSVLVTAASADNVRMVANGEAEIGFTQADIAAEAAAGGARVVALARLYDDYLHLVAREDSGIHTLADLRGHRVSIGAPGSGTVGTVSRLLKIAGIDPVGDFTALGLNLDESVTAMRSNRIHAFFFSGGLPVRAVKELATVLPVRLVSMGDHVTALREEYGPYGQLFAVHAVPQSAYGLAPATTIGVPNYLVVSPNMPEATAYALVRALFTGRATLEAEHPSGQRLNVRDAINTFPLPLHPGAAAWYRDNKR